MHPNFPPPPLAVHEPEKDAPVPERNSAEPEQPAEEQTTEPQAQKQRTEAEALARLAPIRTS